MLSTHNQGDPMVLAFFGALLIGLSLSLLGSGGTILTNPVLVLILKRPEKIAVVESLAIVGIVSICSAIPYALRQQIHGRSLLFFGVPGVLGAFAGAWVSLFISGSLQLTLFAVVMLAASALMLIGPVSFSKLFPDNASNWTTVAKGFIVGCLTGLIGVGGGFLIVPALIALCHLPITLAVGTSLVIIALNALVGFIAQCLILPEAILISWKTIAIVSAVALCGSIIGCYLSSSLPQKRIRQLLGGSIFLLGFYILIRW